MKDEETEKKFPENNKFSKKTAKSQKKFCSPPHHISPQTCFQTSNQQILSLSLSFSFPLVSFSRLLRIHGHILRLLHAWNKKRKISSLPAPHLFGAFFFIFNIASLNGIKELNEYLKYCWSQAGGKWNKKKN